MASDEIPQEAREAAGEIRGTVRVERLAAGCDPLMIVNSSEWSAIIARAIRAAVNRKVNGIARELDDNGYWRAASLLRARIEEE